MLELISFITGRGFPPRSSQRAARLALVTMLAASSSIAQPSSDSPAASPKLDPALFSGLRWRLIGPFRGGRVSAGAIDPDPNTYYIGTPGGGVWKTTDAGQVWTPIFDAIHVASIGAIAVSWSNHRIVYVGTGEQTAGNGIYKSTDAGATWTSLGLSATHVIGEIIVDQENPEIVLVSAIGDRTSGPERGVFKSTDGGRSWRKVLHKDDAGGSVSLVAAVDNPRVLYATLAGLKPGAGTTLYKSIDRGDTWSSINGPDPPAPSGRQALATVAGTRGERVFVNRRDGLFRSDDGGQTWQRSTSDPRIAGIGVISDPMNPDIVYVTQTSMYRSIDGGRTFESFAGAPSGDDFRLLWIDPRNSNRLLAGVDQGGIVSVDGGKTWSNWYNQPTAQLYHVSTDNAFPYRVYAAQQDSGTAAMPSRSDYGAISFRDWSPIGGFEFGFIAPDPGDANLVYSQGWYHTIVRFDRATGQVAHVFVPGAQDRTAGMLPLVFAPHDPHALYLGTQQVLVTRNGGGHWSTISPDLTERKAPAPATAPAAAASTQPGQSGPPQPIRAISTLSPSPVQPDVIWVGTTNGIVQVTDAGVGAGAAWREVTPPDLHGQTSINSIEAGRHDARSAYVAVRLQNDSSPYIYRTHDRGRTWQKITGGLDASAVVRVVREDAVRRGLLYAGTETGVYVSFDDGDHWQSLQLNLPTSVMTDLAVHGDDLIVSTFGRSLWILDDVTPLRQIDALMAKAGVHLFRPQTAVRVRWDVNQDTPLPIETPVGQNPPDGAMIDYYLEAEPAGELTLTIRDRQGALVREYSSRQPNEPAASTSHTPDAAPQPALLPNVPEYWFAPPAVLSKTPGMHRFVWNLRYPNPKALAYGYFGRILPYIEYTLADHAIPGETPRDQPEGPLVAPGEYIVELAVDGRTMRQPLTVNADPRVRASQADLIEQLALARDLVEALDATHDAYEQISALKSAIAERLRALPATAAAVSGALKALDGQTSAIADGTAAAPGVGPLNRELTRYYTMLESADARPAEALKQVIAGSCQALANALAGWRRTNAGQLAELNASLAREGLPALPVVSSVAETPTCKVGQDDR